jgi:hypothetical protein
MLADTRFADHFDFFGDWQNHFGIFDGCGTAMPFSAVTVADGYSAGDASESACC